MIRHALRRAPALLLLGLLAASPVLAAEPRRPAGLSSESFWSILFERALDLFGISAAIGADTDRGPTMDPWGTQIQCDCSPAMDPTGR